MTSTGQEVSGSVSDSLAKPKPATASDFIVGEDAEVDPVLTVVIPTMNEEEGIGTCLDWVHEAVAELEVETEIIVSDSSTDRTPDIARKRDAIVVEPDEPGYGYAYRYGFERARGEYLVMGDADTTYDFSEIPRLLDHLQETGADMVMGNRLDGEIKPGSMPPLHKHVGNPLLTRFLNTFYEADVGDAHSGFRVFTADALEQLELQTDGMEFASEMIMAASEKGLDIEEVPITYHERVGEETLDSFQDGWRHVRFMLVNAPGYLFSGPGVGLAIVGVALMVLTALDPAFFGANFGPRSMVGGSLLTIVGFQLVYFNVFTSVAAEPIRGTQDPLTGYIKMDLSLERGATLGIIIMLTGGAFTAMRIGTWASAQSGPLESLVPDIAAFTLIVIGLQVLFGSFCISVLAQGN
jgi:hypothetical protein